MTEPIILQGGALTMSHSEPLVSAPAFAIDGQTRTRLFHSLLGWTGDRAAAEDLTQETLLEAWRSTRKPDDPAAWMPWLFGIARNVLLRWRRAQAIHGHRVAPAPENADQLEALAEDVNLDAIMSEREIADLIDDALGHVPPATRTALLLRYIDGLSQRETADRLGLNEKTLEGKLHRGKRAVHRHLITERPQQAADLGLISSRLEWSRTPFWCPWCGLQRLEIRYTEVGDCWVDCPSCTGPPLYGRRATVIRTAHAEQGVVSVRPPSLEDVAQPWIGVPLATGIGSTFPCLRCSGVMVTRLLHQDALYPSLRIQCSRCRFIGTDACASGSTVGHPIVHAWRQTEERVGVTGVSRTTFSNRTALRVEFASRTSSRTLTSFRDATTFRFLGFERNGELIEEARLD